MNIEFDFMIAEEVSFLNAFISCIFPFPILDFEVNCYSVRGPVQLAPALAETWENHY